MSVIILPSDGDAPHITRFPGPQAPRAAFVDQQVLLVVLHSRVVAIGLATGESLGETAYPPGLTWVSGRYFSPGSGIQFASWNGARVQWDEALSGREHGLRDVALAFEREKVGTWLLLRNGAVLSPTGKEHLHAGVGVAHAAVCADGERLSVTDRKGKHHLIDLTAKSVTPVVTAPDSADRSKLSPPTRPVVTRFEAIARVPGGRLGLRKTRNAQWMELTAAQGLVHLAPVALDTQEYNADVQPFRRINAPMTLGCELHEASWPDGSRAWLDTRGLLHLRNAAATLPELTIVLCEGSLTAWSSDGNCGGQGFFTGKHGATADGFAAPLLEKFCAKPC